MLYARVHVKCDGVDEEGSLLVRAHLAGIRVLVVIVMVAVVVVVVVVLVVSVEVVA
jgi:hypothetical protein